MKRSEIIFGLLRIPLDFLMVMMGFLLGYQLRLQGDFIPGKQFDILPSNFPSLAEYQNLALTFAGMLVLVFAFFGLYGLRNTESYGLEIRKTLKHSLVWMLLMMAYFFLVRELFFSRLVLIFGAALSMLLLMGARSLLRLIEHALLKADIGRRQVLLIGANEISARLAKKLNQDPRYELLGYLTEKSARLSELKMLGTLNDLKRVVKKYKVESIIQTTQDLSTLEDHEIMEFCQTHQLEYRFVPDLLAVERSNIEIEMLGGYPLIHMKPTPLDGWGRIHKRGVDILGSLLGLFLLSPLLALIAIGIKLDSKGPVFFSRLEDGNPAYRVGQGGKRFKFIKFRTMKHNSHHLREELAEKSHRKGPLFKVKNDPRITQFGAFLRRFSLDELPNLWNVLVGDMSLVGPRPHLPEEVANYEKHHRFLLTIKPGITGFSQISGRSDLDFENEVRMDSAYIKHWSPWLDLKILLKTAGVVLGGKAAD